MMAISGLYYKPASFYFKDFKITLQTDGEYH